MSAWSANHFAEREPRSSFSFLHRIYPKKPVPAKAGMGTLFGSMR
jgi:hypothetical protein